MFGLSQDERRMAQYNKRGEQFGWLIDKMNLGYTTPENVTEEDLAMVYHYFANMPLLYPAPGRDQYTFELKGWTSLDEGTGWAFATHKDGKFGIWSPENMPDTDWTDWQFHIFYRPEIKDGKTIRKTQAFSSLPIYQAVLDGHRKTGMYDVLINRAV